MAGFPKICLFPQLFIQICADNSNMKKSCKSITWRGLWIKCVFAFSVFLLTFLEVSETAGVESFFQLLVVFEEPKIKMVKFWKTRCHSPQSSCDWLKQSPELPQGWQQRLHLGSKVQKDRAEMVSGGICSAVPFIPNGVEILKKNTLGTL